MDNPSQSTPGPGSSTTATADGAAIPALGFGTWELDSPTARRMVGVALGLGYRHVDTAQIYENEAAVGQAVEESGVHRGQVWLTTKVWPGNYGADRFADSVRASLDRLRVGAVDLLLLHWPRFEGTDLEAVVERLAAARDQGWTRHIGVSNFNAGQVARAAAASPYPLTTNQVEYHPYLSQRPVLLELEKHRMALTAYCPIAQGKVVGDPVLREIGAHHGKSEVQVTLRWLLQQPQVLAIPRTSKTEHCRQNFDIFDFELSPEEMDRISALARPDGRMVSPRGLAPAWD